MERPQSPTIEPSEPEQERMLAEHALEMATSEDTLKQVNLAAVGELFAKLGFDVDEDGFIIDQESQEYVKPYGFSRTVFKETESPVDNVFDTYFIPLDETEGGFTQSRIHLSGIHAILHDADGNAHPVRDDVFNLEQFHRRTGMMFEMVMGWSDVLHRAHFEGFADEVDVVFNKFSGDEDVDIRLNCFAPDCEFSGLPEAWDGEENEPICPDCGGEWDEKITVCTACQEWHWGANFDGDSMHAMPVCPDCGADTDMLERQTRYDDL